MRDREQRRAVSTSTFAEERVNSRTPSQRGAFVHRDVVGLIALDLILRLIFASVVRVPFVVDVSGVHLDNRPADVTRLRVPAHMIPDLEFFLHVDE